MKLSKFVYGLFFTILFLNISGFFYLYVFLVEKTPANSIKKQETLDTREDLKGSSNYDLQSFYNKDKNYESVFEDCSSKALKEQALAGIVSHHFLARDLIGDFFCRLQNPEIKNLIIAGPDHFGQLDFESAYAATSFKDWDTPFGAITVNSEIDLAQYLKKSPDFVVEDNLFGQEHSVYTLIPFARKTFPLTEITPLIFKKSNNFSYFEDLGRKISSKVDPGKTLLIISNDFCHYKSQRDCLKIDKKNIDYLNQLNSLVDFGKIKSDCPQCLAFLKGYLGQEDYSFRLFENKNSADYGGGIDNVTGYISAGFFKSFEEEKIAAKNQISLLFTGDLMFDRYIRQVAAQKGNDFIFGDTGSLLQKQDLVITNLEGPITMNPSISQGTPIGGPGNMIFTFDPSLAETLKQFNIKMVNIGNNHILNFGQKGLEQTKNFLDQEEIEYFGTVNQLNNSGLIKNFQGVEIGFLNYNQFARFQTFEEFKNKIRLYKDKHDLVIVYAHWDREYQTVPLPKTREKAHEMIEEGADLIIGSHSHVIGEKEVYKGKKIYYSLGNFIFDQYFRADARSGLLVEVKIDPLTKILTTREIFVKMKKNGQTKISEEPEKQSLSALSGF
ncbi:MAG: AmmeMemoRadiSam system protein B [Candidatus Moranbacteria bacterium]|nr:AmmeMemoRadiSam system protein B [Candidatus Moranbacteria bacterium]